MRMICETEQKRFREGETELLRMDLVLPKAEGGAEMNAFRDFYRDISERSVLFAETELLPRLRAVYAAMSTHDRKFHPPKYRYTVSAEIEEQGDADCKVLLNVSLRSSAGVLYESSELQCWAMRRGALCLIPPSGEKRRETLEKRHAELRGFCGIRSEGKEKKQKKT